MRHLLALLLFAPSLCLAQTGLFIGEAFLSYESCFASAEITGCTIGESYVLRATGLYTVWGGSCDQGDAAFEALNLATPTPYSPWVWNDICDGCQNNRPTPDLFNPEHVYEFPFIAESETQTFHFQDSGGCGNNCGGIQFEIYEVDPPAIPAHVPLEGLIAWYPLDQSLEDSHGGHDGFGSSPSFEVDGGILLQSGDAPVELPSSLVVNDMGGGLTMGGWIRQDATEMVWRVVIDLTNGNSNNAWSDRATLSAEQVDGVMRWVTGFKTGDDMANNVSRVLSLPDPDMVGVWRHVMAVWDVNDVVKIYVNGAPLDGSLDISDATDFDLTGGNTGSRRIGGRAHNSDPNRLWHGAMKDIGIWGRALQADEIEGLYLSTPGCTDPSACNYQSYATHDNGGCDYCSCVGKFHLGASFSNPIVSHGTQEIYTPWGAADLSEIEDVSVTKLVGGEGFFVALKEDSTIAVISPELNTNPIQFDQPVIDIAAGRGDISAVLLDGSVADFGNNSSDYFITEITNATHCARSWNFGMALKEDGSLDGWGNFYPSPDSLTDIIAIDAGVWHAVALTSDGRIHEWGYDGQSGEVLTSSEAIASLTGIVDISAGTSATMAIFEDGSAKAWTWPEGMVYLDIPASEGVVDGAVNWSISTYITYDGRSVTSSNFGNADVQLDVEPQIACGVCVYDFDGNDICNEGAVLGCIDSTACNYELAHTIDDGSCIPSGCLDASACNFNPLAQCAGEACDFSCCPGPGCCSSVEYWDAVLQQCIYPAPDTLIIMVTDTVFIESETSPISCGAGTVWDPVNEECIVAIPADINFDGCVTVADLLELLAVHGTCPPYPEWPDNTADNTWTCGDPLNYWDYDYATVLIGEQCWFAENLRAENYRNGDPIPSDLSGSEWTTTTSGATSTYGEGISACSNYSPDIDACDEAQALVEFGRLYNWHATDDPRGICPSGWHVPHDGDWTSLEEYVGSQGHFGTEGMVLKSSTGWHNSGNGTDHFGFRGLPSGFRSDSDGHFWDAGNQSIWWSSTPSSGTAWTRFLNSNESEIERYNHDVRDGFSVRCIKD